jgi:carbon storage regulator
MLVLSRKAGDEIVIDGRIRVTITAVKGDRVKVGIAAPPEVTVDRAEVHEKRQEWAEADAII